LEKTADSIEWRIVNTSILHINSSMDLEGFPDDQKFSFVFAA